MRNNCTNSRIQNEFWWLIEKRLVLFLFKNLNSQLMKVIEFKKYDFRIDQNSFRSIIRVKRFYWTFFYRMCSISRNSSNLRNLYDFECFNNHTNCKFNIFRRYFILRMSIVKRNNMKKKRNSIEKTSRVFALFIVKIYSIANWIVSETSLLMIV